MSRVRRSIILVTVVGILVVIAILSLVAIYLMTQQAYITEHKIRRMRAFYAAQAGIVHILEQLRKGETPATTITVDGITVTIQRNIGSGPNNTDEVSATVNY